MAVTVTDTAAQLLQESLLERFHQFNDGFWYPASLSKSLVRIKVVDGIYTIQRRREVTEPWTLLVKALVSDFDPGTFARWADEWKLVIS